MLYQTYKIHQNSTKMCTNFRMTFYKPYDVSEPFTPTTGNPLLQRTDKGADSSFFFFILLVIWSSCLILLPWLNRPATRTANGDSVKRVTNVACVNVAGAHHKETSLWSDTPATSRCSRYRFSGNTGTACSPLYSLSLSSDAPVSSFFYSFALQHFHCTR